MTLRNRDRVLLSLATSELDVVLRALETSKAADAAACLASLREKFHELPTRIHTDIVETWAEGASVQVRAIELHGDPVDMSAREARSFARRIFDAADAADAS